MLTVWILFFIIVLWHCQLFSNPFINVCLNCVKVCIRLRGNISLPHRNYSLPQIYFLASLKQWHVTVCAQNLNFLLICSPNLHCSFHPILDVCTKIWGIFICLTEDTTGRTDLSFHFTQTIKSLFLLTTSPFYSPAHWICMWSCSPDLDTQWLISKVLAQLF